MTRLLLFASRSFLRAFTHPQRFHSDADVMPDLLVKILYWFTLPRWPIKCLIKTMTTGKMAVL